MKISHFLVLVLLFSGTIPAHADSMVLDIAKFTDVPALFASVQKAKVDANVLPRAGADGPHIEKAIESLNAALTDSFTAANIDNLFQNVRQAVTSLETVKGPKVGAQKIASDLTEAIRVATEKFLANVERAIPRLTDTKTRENATKDLAKSLEDYGRGAAAISNNRTAAINHFHQAIKRMVEYPLTASTTSPKFQLPNLATDSFIEIRDASGNVIERIPLPERPLVAISPNGEYAAITFKIVQGDTRPARTHTLLHAENGLMRSFEAMPYTYLFVTNSGAVAVWGGWLTTDQGRGMFPCGFQIFDGSGNVTDSRSMSYWDSPEFASDTTTSVLFIIDRKHVTYFDSRGQIRFVKELPARYANDIVFTPDGDIWISYWFGSGRDEVARWWHWIAATGTEETIDWEIGPHQSIPEDDFD